MLLRILVEESIDHRVSTSNDFIYLAGVIQGRVKECISVTTLKRIWGYIDGYSNIRETTLNILAKFIGYPDYETFVSDYCDKEAVHSSQRMYNEPLTCSDLSVGEKIEIQWNPGRMLHLKYLGNNQFEVIRSVKSKVKEKDTFYCHSFYLHQPCYLENLIQKNELPCNFVVGNKGGLTVIRRLDDEE